MNTFKVAVVTSRFNPEITIPLKEGAIQKLREKGIEVVVADVAGAIEIPIVVQAFLEAGCDGAIACGAVIRGETTHYEMVCESVNMGLTTLSLQTKKPIAQAVLTCENEEQALARIGGHHGHKGVDSAEALIDVLKTLRLIRTSGQNMSL